MPHTYALSPWIWSDAEQAHSLPSGAGSCSDWRPEAEQARAGQSSGWSFFAWPDQIYDESGTLVPNPHTVSLDVIQLGYGDCRELQPTTAQRDELRTRLGLSAQPSGATLVDCIASVLGELADPTGTNGPKPLLPTREGVLEIHFAYHSRVWSEAFAGGAMFSSTAKGKANRIRDVIRGDLETAHQSGGPELVAKVLGHWCDRWGVSYTQAAKWRNLIREPLLAELLGKSGGKFAPKKPRTSYSDDFNDGDLTGWTATTGTWDNDGDEIRYNDTLGNGMIRFDSDLSSSDHWSTITHTAASSMQNRIGLAVRFAAGASTGYVTRYTNTAAGLRKVIGGTTTNLGSTFSQSSLHTPTLDIAGSALSYKISGTTQTTTTDTAITGNTRCGCYTVSGSTITPSRSDNWSCDDGVSAGGQPMALRTAGQRRGWSRVGRAW